MDCAVSAIVTSSSESDGGIVPTCSAYRHKTPTARTLAVTKGRIAAQ